MQENHWLPEKEASEELGVSQTKLKTLREYGYLKPGTHWRSSPDPESFPWSPKVLYHLKWCKEGILYWSEKDAPINELVA